MSRRFSNSRELAYEVLERTLLDNGYANIVMSQLSRNAALSERDMALAVELSYGTLRRLGSLDTIVEQYLDPKKQLPAQIEIILRLGAYQLLFTRIPVHAALSETVNLCRYIRKPNFTKLVNAVLRRVSQYSFDKYVSEFSSDLNSDALLSFEKSMPEWIIRAFRQSRQKQNSVLAISETGDDIHDLLEANNTPARVNVAVLADLSDSQEEELVSRSEKNRYSPIGRSLFGNSPSSISSIRKGSVRVQDEGSQLAALALLAARPFSGSERWADFCAGPGGKAAVLLAEAKRHNIEVVINEVSPHRAELVRKSLTAIAPDQEVLVEDARTFPEKYADGFDRILLDAPCSGLGSLRRRPESRWNKYPEDLGQLLALQRELLEAAVHCLAPGGILAYVTCSPHYAETVQQVRWLQEKHNISVLNTPDILNTATNTQMNDIATEMGAVQLWPDRHNTDAMFISLIQKKDSIG